MVEEGKFEEKIYVSIVSSGGTIGDHRFNTKSCMPPDEIIVIRSFSHITTGIDADKVIEESKRHLDGKKKPIFITDTNTTERRNG